MKISEDIMAEQIYTIPINEAFAKTASSEKPDCPFCALYSMLENNAVEAVMGAAKMEPDVRIETNKKGFCKIHYKMMRAAGSGLGLGLILESHIAEVEKNIFEGGTLFDAKGEKEVKKLVSLENSCYVCDRTNENFSRLLSNAVYMWETEYEFRDKFKSQRVYCMPHYRRLLEEGAARLSKKDFAEFFKAARSVMQRYIEELGGDVSWFCKKFDYRYDKEPWYNSKDAVSRAINFLVGGENEKNQ